MEKYGEIKSVTVGSVEIKLTTDHKHEGYERNEDGSYPVVVDIEINKDGIQTKGMRMIPKK